MNVINRLVKLTFGVIRISENFFIVSSPISFFISS